MDVPVREVHLGDMFLHAGYQFQMRRHSTPTERFCVVKFLPPQIPDVVPIINDGLLFYMSPNQLVFKIGD